MHSKSQHQSPRRIRATVCLLKRWEVLAAVLMPDHLHVIAAPTEDRDAAVGDFSAAIKRWMRQEIETGGEVNWQWQPGCFDRLLRSNESLGEKWLYIEGNPVRAGLVKRYEDWPYRFVFNEQK